jgi:hypothetical protein
MTEDDLQAIEERVRRAAMDPWLPGALRVTEFIAAAHADLPALVAEVRNLRWVLEVIEKQQDGPWGNFARMALDGTMKIAATRERWSEAAARAMK